MAIRFDNSADRLLRTASLPDYNAAYTWMGWVYLVSDLNLYTHIVGLNRNSAAQDYDYIGTGGDGVSLSTLVDDTGGFTEQDSTYNFTVGAWVHLTVVRASVTSLTVWINGAQQGAANTRDVTGRPAATRFEMGAFGTGDLDRADIRLAHVKVWTTNLSATEILQEYLVARPVRTDSLHLWSPLWASGDTIDLSGNGRDWTAGGALTTEDGPPVGYGAQVLAPPFTAASGTNYNIIGNIASTSTTPDTAAQTVSRALVSNLASTSMTPDTATVLVSRALTSAIASTSSAPDTATLETALQFAASIASTSSTPTASSLLVSRALVGSVPSASSTPDTATLGLQRPISAALASTSFATDHPWLVIENYALRFYGTASAQIDRVRIPLRSGASPTTADVGAGDFTYEVWLNCAYANNTSTSTTDWRFSNIVLDRDVWNGVMGHGLGVARSGANLVAVFGVAGVGLTHVTLAGTSNIGNSAWHHVAVVRRQSTGLIELYVDGALEDSGTYSTGDLSYDDSNDGGQDNDAIILGTEKHDVGAGYSGLLDSLRISTTRRYTAGFTPAANFVPDASTALLYHHNQGTGTVLGDSATLAGSPTNGALLVGGANNGPTWELSSLFTKRLTSAVASQSTTPTNSALAVLRALAAALASQSTTPDAAALLISRALTVALASQSTTPDTAALIVARAITGALASLSATPDTVALLAVVQFIGSVASASSTPDISAILVSRALVASVASQSTTPDDAELSIAGLISLVASIASQSTTPDAALLAVARTLAAAIASQSSSPGAASLLVSRALSAALASTSTTPDASALLVARRLVAAIASQSTTPDDAELFAGGVIGMMRATLTARAPSVTFTARTPSVTFTVEE